MGLCCWLNSIFGGLSSLFWYGLILIALGRVLVALYNIVFPFVIAPLLGQNNKFDRHCRAGEWAVVTGATDGIGKEYARQIAAKGCHVVLIARNSDKLAAVKSEIEESFPGIKVKTIQFDFTANDHKKYAPMEQELNGLNIGALVNNVGISYTELGPIGTVPDGEKLAQDMLNINCLSLVLMSRMVIEGMAKRGRGAVINLSSASGVFPVPYLTIYSASKKFVDFFSTALGAEYSDKGVVVQSVCPFFVATKMSGMKKRFSCPTPEDYVRSALGSFELQSRTFGCFPHALQGELSDLLPLAIALDQSKKTMGALMRKQQAKKKQSN